MSRTMHSTCGEKSISIAHLSEEVAMRRAAMMFAMIGIAAPAAAIASDGGGREFRLMPYYSIEPGSHWITAPQPTLLRRPDLQALGKIVGGGTIGDFGLSFDCAVMSSGRVDDCRTIIARPAGGNAGTLLARLTPSILLDRDTVEIAKTHGYRLTFDVAVMDFPPPPAPIQPCVGAICGGDPPPAPPPPPQPADPLLAFAVARGQACFDDAWKRMSIAADAADAALRDGAPAAGTPAYRDRVLDYLTRRQTLAECVNDLRHVREAIPTTNEDQHAYDVNYGWMANGYHQIDRDLIAVLAGALDRHAAEAEQQTSF